MKHVNTLIAITCILCFSAQSQVLNQNFNSGLPASWTQSPANTWSLNPNLGINASPCVISVDSLGTAASSLTSIRTPTLNLAGITNPTVTFRAALVKVNFIIPNITLSYSTSAGKQFVARWGSGFTTPTTYTTWGGTDYTPPLDAQNVYWDTCIAVLPTFTANTIVSFVFDAEFVNAGYVLLDDVVIAGTNTTVTVSLKEQNMEGTITLYPNPAREAVTVKGRDIKTITLHNSLGQLLPFTIKGQDEEGLLLHLSGLARGIYYLNVVNPEGASIRKKLVVN